MADLELNSIGNGDGNNYLLRDNSKIPLSGSSQISGDLVPSTDNSVNLGDSTYGFADFYTNKIYLKGSTIFNVADDNYICMGGATAQANGANLVLNGKNRSTSTGEFKLEARDGTNVNQLIGKPNGNLSWSGGELSANNDSKFMSINGGSTDAKGGYIIAYGKDYSGVNPAGGFKLVANNGVSSYKSLIGYPNGTLKWNGQSIQTTSDQRLKQQISQIDDDLLTAWEDVNPVQFKYNDAVDQKGDNARLHTGYVVQQIDEACKSHNVDISKYGLYCHEIYQEETREVEQSDGTKTIEVVRPANEHYSLRYTETLVVECAYLRRENNRLKERLSKIEKLLNI